VITSLFSFVSDTKALEAKQDNWCTELAKNLPIFDYQNLVVITDYAYPQQSNLAIKTICTGNTRLTESKYLLALVDNALDVGGTIYVDKKLPSYLDTMSTLLKLALRCLTKHRVSAGLVQDQRVI
jgi:hypothetical protein